MIQDLVEHGTCTCTSNMYLLLIQILLFGCKLIGETGLYEPRELKVIIKPLLILFCKVHWMFLQGAGQGADKNYCKQSNKRQGHLFNFLSLSWGIQYM